MVANDEATRVACITGFSNNVGYAFFAKRLLGLPGTRAFRNRVNTERQNPGEAGLIFEIEGMAHRDASLFHGCRCESRKPDHIPCGVDVRDIRLVVLIDLQEAALVSRDANFFKTKCRRIPLATGCLENGVKRYDSIAFEGNIELLCRTDRLHRIAKQKLNTHSCHSALQGRRDFRIKEAK